MKLQIDTENKTIKVEQNYKLADIVKNLEKLLPKNSPFGYWKDYTLETDSIWYWYPYPCYTYRYPDIEPIKWEVTSASATYDDTTTSVYNVEVLN